MPDTYKKEQRLRRPRVVASAPADEHNRVLSLEKCGNNHRRTPCPGCPWRLKNAGTFPAQAFRLTANTAYDASWVQFSCHESGVTKPAICAGFLLRNAENNLGTRMAQIKGEVDLSMLVEPDDPLFVSYRAMAIANGVSPDDPAIQPCRANYE